jgi:CRP-like cAMP-binding protein
VAQTIPDAVLRERRRPAGRPRPEQGAQPTLRRSATALAGVPLFVGFSKRDLSRLAAEADELRFEPGQVVVQEGAPGETLFVILSGEARVVRGGRTLARLRPGDFFGELSALDGGPRSATIVAETPVAVLRLFRRTLVSTVKREPQLALKLMDGIVRRVREIDRRLEA